MNQHREIFNQLMTVFGYSAKQVSAWSNVGESRLSRFRRSKLDLEAGEFFHMLESLPQEAQDYFWSQKKIKEYSSKELMVVAKELIATVAADETAIAELLNTIASSLRSNNFSNFTDTPSEKALL